MSFKIRLIIIFCVYVKGITLCNCWSSSSCVSASLMRNIGEFRAKHYFTGNRTAITMNRFRDSIPVLKIHGCYKDQKFRTAFHPIQAIQGDSV